jgi:hypothetical protein
MAEIAVTILDPSNNRSAHLVETRLPVRELIPPIVARLKLPERATYQLFPLGSDNALPAERTLVESGVPAGAELQLRPVRNQILKAILDKLYEEAEGYVQEQAWELAKEKLEALLQLDPTYPDPLGLEPAVAAQVPSLRSVPRTERLTPRSQPARSGRPTIPPVSATPSANATLSPSPSGGGAYQLAPEAAKRSGTSCLSLTLMIVAVVVVGSIALAGAVFFLPSILSDVAERIGIPLPGTVVLGTGDVQVTLRWEGEADLDLHVIDPAGEEISFASPQSTSGGILDVDANGGCEGLAQPVENIYWPTGEAPTGSYAVSVVYYQSCGRTAPTDYEVTITLDGAVLDVIHAQIATEGEQHPVANFDY